MPRRVSGSTTRHSITADESRFRHRRPSADDFWSLQHLGLHVPGERLIDARFDPLRYAFAGVATLALPLPLHSVSISTVDGDFEHGVSDMSYWVHYIAMIMHLVHSRCRQRARGADARYLPEGLSSCSTTSTSRSAGPFRTDPETALGRRSPRATLPHHLLAQMRHMWRRQRCTGLEFVSMQCDPARRAVSIFDDALSRLPDRLTCSPQGSPLLVRHTSPTSPRSRDARAATPRR